MCNNIERHIEQGQSVDFFKAYKCFALDGITSFCFGTSMHATSEPNFDAPTIHAMHVSLSMMQSLKHFILFKKAVRAIPENVAAVINPTLTGMAKLLGVRTVFRVTRCALSTTANCMYRC